MRRLAPLCIPILLAGCYELDQEVSLNPDGSGKIKIHLLFSPFQISFANERTKTPDEQLVDAVREKLEKA